MVNSIWIMFCYTFSAVCDERFYMVGFMSFYDLPDEGYLPGEIGAVEYSLNGGLLRKMHYFIKPGLLKYIVLLYHYFRLSVVKTKPVEWSLQPITKVTGNLVNKSKLKANARGWGHQALENAWERVTIGISFPRTDWMRKWHGFLNQLLSKVRQNHSKCELLLTFM